MEIIVTPKRNIDDDGWEEFLKRIDEKFNTINTRMDDHFSGCKDLCMARLQAIDLKTEKAHERLDKQKSVIECLVANKNREAGFRKAVSFILGILTVFIAWLEVTKK